LDFLDKAREKQKTQYDKKAKASVITMGDSVLIKVGFFKSSQFSRQV